MVRAYDGEQRLPTTVRAPAASGVSPLALAGRAPYAPRVSNRPIESSMRPPPRTRRPREDEPTLEIATGSEPRVASLPPRNRGTLVALTGAHAGAVYAVERELVLGRSSEAHVSLDDASLSRQHARVLRADDGFYVEDLGSKNGTFVNGRRIHGRVRLQDGDRISIGATASLRFALQDELEQRTVQQLYESAVRDPLTGLFNRRHLDDRLRAEHSFALRHGTDLTVMLVDVDHFKQVNDTYGHAAGDGVLRVVGGTLGRMLRGEDLVARYGGEEFCVLARALDARNAGIVAERCRQKIASLSLPWEGRRLSITVSIGVATLSASDPSRYPDPRSLLDAADRALYAAKESGRDRVCVA